MSQRTQLGKFLRKKGLLSKHYYSWEIGNNIPILRLNIRKVPYSGLPERMGMVNEE